MSAKLPDGAPKTMVERGKATDSAISEYIESHPNASIKEISDSLDMSIGRVHGSVDRLEENGLVNVEFIIKNGVFTKRVTSTLAEIPPVNQIRVPENLVNIDAWKTKVNMYALSRSAIGLSPFENTKWEKDCLYKSTITFSREPESIQMSIPNRIVNFYELPNSETEIVGLGDSALVTIKSTIIPIQSEYPSHRVARRVRVKERITEREYEIIEVEENGVRNEANEMDFNIDLEFVSLEEGVM